MITKGVILAVQGDTAQVRIHRVSACETCHNKDANGTCHAELMLSETPRTLCVTADNPVGAAVGDLVEVATDERRGLLLSFVAFVVPILIAAIAFAALDLVGLPWLRILLAVGVFVLSFVLCLHGADRYSKKHIRIRIERILPTENAG